MMQHPAPPAQPVEHLSHAFVRAREEGRTALVVYLMAGDPDIETTVELACAAAGAGVDVLELGVPFSDPLADGPVIAQAATRSIASGCDVAAVLEAVRAIRARVDVPIVLMGYANPFLQHGLSRTCDELAAAGGCGLLVPDLPPGENADLRAAAAQAGVAVPLMVTPVTPAERRSSILRLASGFVYCMSTTGTTGSRAIVSPELLTLLDQTRQECDMPVIVGFGVSTPEQVAGLGPHADGVVVGSALVRLVHEVSEAGGDAAQALQEAIADLRART